ncbi:MAG: hypothetical protein IPM78_09290 [Moraxellaceae bacterium]|nr:hypothetical protein [Moraxellaceae bacterium]
MPVFVCYSQNYLSRDDLTPETLLANEARFRSQAETDAFSAIANKLGQRRLRQFKNIWQNYVMQFVIVKICV